MPSRREGSKLRMHARALLLHLAHLAIGAAAMPPETTTTGDHTCTTSLSPSSLLFLPPPCCCYISLGKKGLYLNKDHHHHHHHAYGVGRGMKFTGAATRALGRTYARPNSARGAASDLLATSLDIDRSRRSQQR